jgi:hypothetical protein
MSDSPLPPCRPFEACWFRGMLWLFAPGLPLGLAFGTLAPIPFIRTLGLVAAAAALLGVLVSLIGIRAAEPHLHGRSRSADDDRREPSLGTPATAAAQASTHEALPVWPGVAQPL